MRRFRPGASAFFVFAAAACGLLSTASAAGAAEARIDLLGGEAHRGVQITAIDGEAVSFRDAAGRAGRVAVNDVVSIEFASPVAPAAASGANAVEVRYRGGDRILGALLPGGEDRVLVESAILGRLDQPVEPIEEIRFREAWTAAAEKPPLPDAPELDQFYLRSLDHVEGTWTRAAADGAELIRASGGEQRLSFADLLAIRFATGPAPPAPTGRWAEILLADGGRITAASVSADARKIAFATVRGERLSVDAGRVAGIWFAGGRFVYLSDLLPKSTTVEPWIGEAYPWDRPRFDASLVDRPLAAGGETWRKGIGALSGTTLVYAVPEGYDTFTSRVAIDDAAGPDGDVVFEVHVDGVKKFESEILRGLSPGAAPVRIPPIGVRGAKEIALVVRFADDFVSDFADWLAPMFIRGE